jgi:hypothetical protein
MNSPTFLSRVVGPLLLGSIVGCQPFSGPVSKEFVVINSSLTDVLLWDQTHRKQIVQIQPNSRWRGVLSLGTHDGAMVDQAYIIRRTDVGQPKYILLGETLFPYDSIIVSKDSLKLESSDGKASLVITYSLGGRSPDQSRSP